MSVTRLATDVLVIGCGMAGLTAAARAASLGANVVAVEVASSPGGSAVLSGGIIWAPISVDDYCAMDTKADPSLVAIVVDGLEPGIEWMKSIGVEVEEPMRLDSMQYYPSAGFRFDILGYLDRCKKVLLAEGGSLVTDADVKSLIVEKGRVVGATAIDRDGQTEISADATILATGGFQASPELRQEYLGLGRDALVLRSNQMSRGMGLQLAKSVGATIVTWTDKFYGNLFPTGLPRGIQQSDFMRLSQYHSIYSLLFDCDGNRIGDESASYYGNAWLVSHAKSARALLVGDARVREMGNNWPGGFDRVTEVKNDGGHALEANSIDELAAQAHEWGYLRIGQGVDEFNYGLKEDPDRLVPPRIHSRTPIDSAPYFAVEVQAAITFTFGGIKIDNGTRVTDRKGDPIPGLFAAGVDASIYDSIYGGGLSLALTTGMRAGEGAAAESQLGERLPQHHK